MTNHVLHHSSCSFTWAVNVRANTEDTMDAASHRNSSISHSNCQMQGTVSMQVSGSNQLSILMFKFSPTPSIHVRTLLMNQATGYLPPRRVHSYVYLLVS